MTSPFGLHKERFGEVRFLTCWRSPCVGSSVADLVSRSDVVLMSLPDSTVIEPVVLGDEMVRRVTSIDGAVLLDDEGRCHAVGVILDGRATPDGRPSRGSRYNSALRYVTGAEGPTLAVVISEDGRVDLLPDG